MALPKLNDVPKFNITIPSTGKKVRFRPYLVKEEKVLLMAVESGDTGAAIDAMVDTIESCITEKINVSELTTFDVEYLFTQIRSKSSGESVKLGLKCKGCEVPNETEVKLDDLKIKMPKIKKTVELNEDVSIELRYPPFSVLTKYDFADDTISDAVRSFQLAGECIQAVLFDDERTDNEDITNEEMQEFLESMTTEQFKVVSSFVESMPKLSHTIKFKCVSCDHDNSIVLEGMQSFF
jgi:hypothetical protein